MEWIIVCLILNISFNVIEQFACKSKDSWDDLRCKVQEIFNEKFCKYVNYNKFFTVDSKAEQLRPCGEILYVYCHFSVHGM